MQFSEKVWQLLKTKEILALTYPTFLMSLGIVGTFLQKSQDKDFKGEIVFKKQYTYLLRVLWSYVLKNLDIGALLQNIGSISDLIW